MFIRNAAVRLCVVLLSVGFALITSVALASAKPQGIPATDGDGLMAVSPTAITYGTNSVTLVFTFTANADFGNGSQVKIDIPAGWTTPTTGAGAGHVTWNAGTCTLTGAPPVAVSGSSILIDLASCPTNAYFTVTYANATPGPVSGSPYTFVTWTDIGAGGQGLTQITAGSPTVSVDPQALTVSATGLTPANKIYDSTTAATLTIGSPTLVGVVGTDTVTLVTTGATAHFVDANAGLTKTVNISGLTLTGAQASNYTLIQPTRTATISPRAITISAVNDVKTYDGSVSSSGVPTLTVGALQGSDTATWTQTFNNKHAGAGNKVLTPTGLVNDGNGGNNYAYTYAPFNTGTINKKPITVTAGTDSKIYDGLTSSGGVPQITPTLIAPDTPAFAQAFDTKDVGINKLLTPSGAANDGNNGNNYAYTYVPNTTGVITAKTLAVSAAGLTPANKVYDGLTGTALTSGSPALVGVISPDVVTLVTSGAAANFVDRNVGVGKTVNISGLTLGGAQAGNYDLTQPTRSASITTRPITIAAATDTKEYDGGVSSLGVPTIISSTLGSGDSTPAWTQIFNSKHVGASKTLAVVPSPITDGNSGNNYSYTYATAPGVITKKPITVVAVTDSKAYDGITFSSGTPTLSAGTPLASGDTEPVWTQSFANKNVGTGKTINPAGSVNDGNGGNNYSYTFVPNTTGIIIARAITVTARSDTKTYDATTTSVLTPTFAPEVVGTDTTVFTQTFNTPDAGTNKTLIPAGVVNDGNSGNNYTYTYATAPGVINKATPTLTVTNSPVTYNGLAQAAVITSSVAGAISNINYNGSAITPTMPGTYMITADFTSSDANYADLAGASAGNFVIRAVIYLPLISR